MDYTSNFGLPQWVESDRILMDDFNEAMRKIDTSIKTVANSSTSSIRQLSQTMQTISKNLGTGGRTCRLTWGSYEATGLTGEANALSVEVDFYPVFMVVLGYYDMEYAYDYSPGFFVRGINLSYNPRYNTNSSKCFVEWSDNGLRWWSELDAMMYNLKNGLGDTYYYVVFGFDPKSTEG